MANVSSFPPKYIELESALGHSTPGAQAARKFVLFVAFVGLSLVAIWQLWNMNVWGYAAMLAAIHALLGIIELPD